jgi:hypothetical protein
MIMELILIILGVGAWIWSITTGLQKVSVLCAVLNFVFPPLSQLVFSINNKELRAPFFLMVGVWGTMALIK